jgi:hypothetical protein
MAPRRATVWRGILIVYVCLAFFGLALSCINVAGLVIPLRNDTIYTETQSSFRNDITLTADQLRAALVRGEDEPADSFVHRATMAVNQGIAHYWSPEGALQYRLHLPIWENWLLWAGGYWFAPLFERYEFVDADKAIDRGVGMCSQQALILVEALQRGGVPAHLVALSGEHAVVLADVGDVQWWVADPDYGVVLPYTLKTLHDKPELVGAAYTAAGYDQATVAWARHSYGLDASLTFPALTDYAGPRLTIERAAYTAKWIVPLICLALGILPWRYSMPRTTRRLFLPNRVGWVRRYTRKPNVTMAEGHSWT